MQNKAGFLEIVPNVISVTECLQTEMKTKTEEVINITENIDYLLWIKEILSELQLAAGKNASVDFALEVAVECGDYPLIIEILSQYRRLKRTKCHSGSIEGKYKERIMNNHHCLSLTHTHAHTYAHTHTHTIFLADLSQRLK